MRNMVIKTVNKLKKKYQTNDPLELCKHLNIWCYFVPLGNVKAHYIYSKRKKVFFINENQNELDRYFCVAHELGHALLHSKNNVYFNNENTFHNQSKHELQADMFAAELLVDSYLLELYEGFSLELISKSTGINIKYIELKFK